MYNIILEKKWNDFLNWMFEYDLLFSRQSPTWLINKEIGGVFLHISRKENNKNVYYFDPILKGLIYYILFFLLHYVI